MSSPSASGFSSSSVSSALDCSNAWIASSKAIGSTGICWLSSDRSSVFSNSSVSIFRISVFPECPACALKSSSVSSSASSFASSSSSAIIAATFAARSGKISVCVSASPVRSSTGSVSKVSSSAISGSSSNSSETSWEAALSISSASSS